jgi:hypothetical protein
VVESDLAWEEVVGLFGPRPKLILFLWILLRRFDFSILNFCQDPLNIFIESAKFRNRIA